MRTYRLVGSVAVVVLLGACEVHVGSEPASPQTASNPPASGGGGGNTATPPTPGPAPTQATPPAQPQSNPRGPIKLRFSARVVHPPPMTNETGGGHNAQELKLTLHLRKGCGPKEVAPGTWVHIDCNRYKPIGAARHLPMRKLKLMLRGKLRLDNPIGPPRPGTGGGGPHPTGGGTGDEAQIPEAVDHRAEGIEGPIKDQDVVGCCTAFSLSTTMDNAIRRQNKPDVISPMHLWSHYGQPDMEAAGTSNLKKPIAVWSDWPYKASDACKFYKGGSVFGCGKYFNPPVKEGSADGDATLQAKIKDTDGKGKWSITTIDAIPANPADPDTFAAVLATGADIWIASEIDDNSWGSPKNGVINDWTVSGGGHAIVVAGYRKVNGARQFLIHNSWGTSWADGGYAWVSEKMIRDHVYDAYKITVTDGSAPPPPPNPNPPDPNVDPGPTDDPTALTDDDCDEDSLVDAVTGQCATMCPDDSRPANGQCVASGGGHPPKTGGAAPPNTQPANTPRLHIKR